MKAGMSDYAAFGNNPVINFNPNGDDWFKNNKTGEMVEFDGSWDREGYTWVSEFRTWNNINKSPGEWIYWNFFGRGDSFWWAKDYALEGSADGGLGGGYLGGE